VIQKTAEKFSELKLRNFFGIFLFTTLGVTMCFYLQYLGDLPSFTSSALVGAAGSLLLSPNRFNPRYYLPALYTGSFAAMMPLPSTAIWAYLCTLSILTGVLFIFALPFFNGHGGKLGSIAFLASLLFLGMGF